MSQQSPIHASDIEMSKENVLPLRRGRNARELVEATQISDHDRNAEQQAFECELASYEGNDPLEIWRRYVKWCESAFPSGGDSSPLLSVLEQCCMQFKQDQRYRDSKPYLKLWIKFAHLCPDPTDLFAFLRKQGIGQKHALFYQAWACVMEQQQQFVKAEKVLEAGLDEGAMPLGKLQIALEQLQARRALVAPDIIQTSGVSRDAMLELKRVPQAHRQAQASRSGLRGQDAGPQSENNAKTFTIFHDTMSSHSSCELPRGEFAGANVHNKENSQTPTTWNEPLTQSSKSSTTNRHCNRLDFVPQSSSTFEVFEEQNAHQSETTSSNNLNKLSLRKRLDGVDSSNECIRNNPLRHASLSVSSNEQFKLAFDVAALYDKHSGDKEGLSFEEIRGNAFFASLSNSGIDASKNDDSDKHEPICNSRSPNRVNSSTSKSSFMSSIETFHDSSSNLGVLTREELPPPSPTVTVTMNTREALQDVRAMFTDNANSNNFSDEEDSSNEEYSLSPTIKSTTFTVFEDVEPPSATQELPMTNISSKNFTESTQNPFDDAERQRVIQTANFCGSKNMIDHRCVMAPDEVSNLQEDSSLELDNLDLLIMSRMSKNVFESQNLSAENECEESFAVKITQPCSLWEAYISSCITQRFPHHCHTFITVSSSYHYKDCSLMISALCDEMGTLRKLIDVHADKNSLIPELIIVHITQKLLGIIISLHGSGLLHNAISPRHILFRNELHEISLIDFSCAVDLYGYPQQANFQGTVPVGGVQCPHTTANSEWRFHVDVFGAASCIHEMLLGKPLPLTTSVANIITALPEMYCTDLWRNVFTLLLDTHQDMQAAQTLLCDYSNAQSNVAAKLKLHIVEQNVLLS